MSSSSATSSMHVKADEAIQKLDKVKWANMKAGERLKILEQIQEQLSEEMEDLGVEEAEMRNIKIGTQDNLFTADACRLSAVIPLAFEISSCIELYKANIAGKPLDPVSVTLVDNSQVDEIKFGDDSLSKLPTQNGLEGMAPPPMAPPPPPRNDGDEGEAEPLAEENAKEETGQQPEEEKMNGDDGADDKGEENIADKNSENGEDTKDETLKDPEENSKDTEAEVVNEEADESSKDVEENGKYSEEQKETADDVEEAESGDTDKEGDKEDADDDQQQQQQEEGKDKDDAELPSTENAEENKDVNIVSDDEDDEEPTNTEKAKQDIDDVQIKVVFGDEQKNDVEFVPKNPGEIYYDVLVSPRTWNERGYFNARQDRLRITGDPNMPDCRVGPYDRRDPQATAILGAGSYSAAPEIIKATFLDGHVVVYKPHPNNADIDKIWSEIMKPLVEVGALSYCTHDQGPDLVKHDRIDQIYMIGSAETAQGILKTTDRPCILQTGSVNPVILVPGLDRQWGVREMRHHALQIATAGKHNGGHFCGRPQVIVTSKSWDQRDQFLKELEEALSTTTPPEGSYDPKYRQTFQNFVDMYPDGKIIRQDGVDTSAADVLLVTGCSPKDFYGLQNEAFCQVFIEVCLDAIDHPLTFIPAAVKFCNQELYGSLCATIVIDDQTNQTYSKVIEKALSDLQYGTVSTNVMACVGWNNPALYWGSYKKNVPQDEASIKDNAYFGHFERGAGHFGNLFGYKDACKSIITDTFTGKGHFIKTCRGAYNGKIAALSNYAVDPTWKKLSAYKLKGVRAAAARKDW